MTETSYDRVNISEGYLKSSFSGYFFLMPKHAALNLAYDTTFGGSSHLTCTWMDSNYNWSSLTFSGRCGQSLKLAVNAVTDVLHTLYQAAALASSTTSPSVSSTNSPTTSQTPSISSSPSPSAAVTQAPTNSSSVTTAASPTPTVNISPRPNSTKDTTSTPITPEFSLAPAIVVAFIATAIALVWKLKRPMAIK